MAIEQERLLALIEAGEDALRGLNLLGSRIRDAASRQAEGLTSAEAALEQLSALSWPQFCMDRPVDSATTLRVEREHYQHHWRGNLRKRRQRARRARASPEGGKALEATRTSPLATALDFLSEVEADGAEGPATK